MTINAPNIYPRTFYDTTSSADLVNPNKIESGTLLGPVQVGTQGPVIDPTNNQITAGNITINAGGLFVGGSKFNPTPTSSLVIKGPFTINNTDSGLYSAAGIPLWTPVVGDSLINCWGYCSHSFGTSATDARVYISVGMDGALYNTGVAATDITFHRNNCLRSIVVANFSNSNPNTATSGAVANAVVGNYFWGFNSGSANTSLKGGNANELQTLGYFITSGEVCAKRVVDNGTGGQVVIYAAVLTNNPFGV